LDASSYVQELIGKKYLVFEMCNHPEILEEVRREHDVILGTNVSLAGEILRKDPDVIIKLPWTFAVIQETLRLHGTAGAIRAGETG
jgi:cytochrome P450